MASCLIFKKSRPMAKRVLIVLLSDALNSEVARIFGFRIIPSRHVRPGNAGCTGKAIVTVMSSNIHRMQQVMWAAESHHRKVALVGRSVEQNVKTSLALGFINPPRGGFVNRRDLEKYPDNKLCIIIAGAQGQEGSSLNPRCRR
jgi:ribonuclease J